MGYEEFVPRFREFVREAVPAGATVVVVSKGDPGLVDLGGMEGWHFPQGADGVYAGTYPPDSDGAIAHLERLKERGGEFLAFPAPATWWLDHYEEFGEHVRRSYRLVVEDDDMGVVYELLGAAARAQSANGSDGPPEGLVALRSVTAVPTPPPRRRFAQTTHALRDLGGLFANERTASGGGKLIRVCLVDTVLQTGGAEWSATQLALAANPGVFEVVAVTWRSDDSALADHLRESGIEVVDATSWSSGGGVPFDEWKEEGVFEQLERLSPDIVFFSSQYLFEQLPAERLARFPVVVRISNFHADELAKTDFSAATRIICTTEEQRAALAPPDAEKALVIDTGVDTALFHPLPAAEKEETKRRLGVAGKRVVLFVARLGDPLKRTPVFQDIVRTVQASRNDVAFLVVGYFERHNNDAEGDFREFAASHGVVWKERVPPWEMPALYQAADVLLSTSDVHEGLSNTALQALAAGVVPVVTPSGGMHEIVAPGETGFRAPDFEAASVERELSAALALDEAGTARLAAAGRALVEERFAFARSAAAYQRTLLEVYRGRPARIAITDGYFTTGGAEWLAALLMLNADPAELRFDLVVHRAETPLIAWLEERGFRAHEATPGTSYSGWLEQGMQHTFRRLRPDVVMPCTITTWPQHDPFYRLLAISQNASDAAVLTREQYDQADYILCVSQDVRDQLSAEHQWKMSVLHNSIDLEMFLPDAQARTEVRERLGIEPEARVVLWCGRMHEARKRLDVLMEVASALRDDDSVHFLVVGWFRGDEGDQEGWRAFMEAHPNVAWVEDVPPWETPHYYAASDVYLSTSGFKRSDFEGLSVATVQALATELPVITTMSGGQNELVEEGLNGRLVEPGDARALASALRELLDSPGEELEAIGRRNREKAAAAFDIRAHARLYTRIARVLRNTVGTALATDADLPSSAWTFRDAADAGEERVRTAASFLSYTWPLLREAADGDGDDAPSAAPAELAEAQARLAPGEWVAVRGIAPDYAAGDAGEYDARAICDLLEHLERGFPGWSRCERRGPDLIIQRR